MALGALILYDNAIKEMIDEGNVKIGTDTFEARLFTSSANVTTTSHDDLTDLTNELPSSNGYAAATSAGSVTVATGTTSINFTQFSFSPTSSGFTARYMVISRQGGADDPLIGYCLLDSTPADFTFEPGRTYEFTTSGVIQIGACP